MLGLLGYVLYILGRAQDASIPANRASAIETTLTWAKLPPFPVADRDLELQIKGSPFTRQFIITFKAPTETIKKWMATCPGLDGVKPQPQRDGSLLYRIQPGGGALGATLLLSDKGTRVTVDAWWS
jgi:hypothetical protein